MYDSIDGIPWVVEVTYENGERTLREFRTRRGALVVFNRMARVLGYDGRTAIELRPKTYGIPRGE